MEEGDFDSEIKTGVAQLSQCDWVREEFGAGRFGDRRLLLRFLVVAEHLARHPEAPINQASEVWSKTKAAYRFFDNNKVTDALVFAPHRQRTIARLKQHSGTVLIIQDTTFLNYSHMKSSLDLGPIGELKQAHMGLILHSSLCTTAEGLPLGILNHNIWARSPAAHGKSKQRHSRYIEEKESFKWIRALRSYSPLIPKQVNAVTICDSESDIYDVLAEAQKQKAHILVRAKHNRSTTSQYNLFELAARQPVAFQDTVSLPPQADRQRRDALVNVRFVTSEIICPDDSPRREKIPRIAVSVISVLEEAPPPGQEPLSWMLITNLKIKTATKARQCIAWYKRRWQIEIFHRILKSGCNVELTRLEKNERRFPFIALNCIIAWKLLLMTHYNKICPDSPATSLLSQTECNVLYAITHSSGVKNKKFTAGKALRWLAQLGGFLARKHDGSPGPTHVWRGWQRLQDFTHMYTLTASA